MDSKYGDCLYMIVYEFFWWWNIIGSSENRILIDNSKRKKKNPSGEMDGTSQGVIWKGIGFGFWGWRDA